MSDAQVFEEAFNLMCGELIGTGISRKVFDCRLKPGYVVKVEEGSHSFENVAEWLTWQEVVFTKASKWFARCEWISPNGRILIMERTRPALRAERPRRVPTWASDLKLSNWGVAVFQDQHFVCHDYGSMSSNVIKHGFATTKLKVADWIEA